MPPVSLKRTGGGGNKTLKRQLITAFHVNTRRCRGQPTAEVQDPFTRKLLDILEEPGNFQHKPIRDESDPIAQWLELTRDTLNTADILSYIHHVSTLLSGAVARDVGRFLFKSTELFLNANQFQSAV
jgi:hypothetical protein